MKWPGKEAVIELVCPHGCKVRQRVSREKVLANFEKFRAFCAETGDVVTLDEYLSVHFGSDEVDGLVHELPCDCWSEAFDQRNELEDPDTDEFIRANGERVLKRCTWRVLWDIDLN